MYGRSTAAPHPGKIDQKQGVARTIFFGITARRPPYNIASFFEYNFTGAGFLSKNCL